MRATIYDDPHILKNTFPDVIFSAGRDQLDITLQCRQEEDDMRKSNKDGDTGSNIVTSESCQPSGINASPTQHPGPSASHPRRSARLVQRAQRKPSRQVAPAHDRLRARLLPIARKGLLPDDPTSKQERGPLDRILAFMAFWPQTRKPLYNSSDGWKGWPKMSKAGAESAVVKYLNNLVDCARCFFNNGAQVAESDDDFVFSARYSNRVVNDRAKRKRDIVLIPRRHENSKESDEWRHVRAVGGLKPNVNHSKQELVDEIAERTSLCFGRQRARRFVLAFSLLGTKMALWKYDRSGVVISQEFDIHENPIDFLRIILGLALGPNYHVGYDPSFKHKDLRPFVELNGKDYEVMTVTLGDAILGRGTVVHRVRDEEGREFAMKDQWVDRSSTTKEFSLLEKLEEMNVQKVPRLVDYQIVRFKVCDEVVLDSTANDRATYGSTWLEEMGIDSRVHYRLLMTPYGDGLGSFRSLKELVSVFRDFVEGIRDLREKEIVHQDISLDNLILVEEDEFSCRRGYIIDFDCAAHIGEAATGRMGSLPFIAIDILLEEDVKHEYYHDLESLFYVLIWICFTREGPGVLRHDFDLKKSPLQKWVGSGGREYFYLGVDKYYLTSTRARFKKSILDELPDYFKHSEAMTGFLEQLRSVVFREAPDKWESDKARVLLDREKRMKDRDMHDVFTEIFCVFDEALKRLANEPTPDSEKEATPASDDKTTA